jgi:hypothetical protein
MADDDLLRELNEVRAKNARLRGILGLDRRRAEPHAQSWEPSLFQDAPALPRVDGRSSAEEKVGLYQQLFAGRTDVFASRWQNDASGRSGWSPAVRGGWSKSSKVRRDYLPLTDAGRPVRHFPHVEPVLPGAGLHAARVVREPHRVTTPG